MDTFNNFYEIRNHFKNNRENIENYICNLNNDNFNSLLRNCMTPWEKLYALECTYAKSEDKSGIVLRSFSNDDLLEIWNSSYISSDKEVLGLLAVLGILKMGKTFINKNIKNDLFLESIVEDDYAINLVISFVSSDNLNYFFDFLVERRQIDNINSKHLDLFINYVNSLDDDHLKLVLKAIRVDYLRGQDVNSIVADGILENLITRKKENLILEHFNYLMINHKWGAKNFILLMDKANYYPKEILEFFPIYGDDLKNDPYLILYLNNIIANVDEFPVSWADDILKDKNLIKYIFYSSIVDGYNGMTYPNYDSIPYFEGRDEIINKTKEMHAKISYDELVEIFLDYDEEFVNVILTNFSSYNILKIFKFNFFAGLNKNIKDIIVSFLEKYVSYEKAIFLIDVINISEEEKVSIINYVYPDKKIENVKNEKDIIIKRNLDKILRNDSPVDEEFKYLLPELINIPYNEEFFKSIKPKCLDIKSLEYFQVFLSQLIQYISYKNKLDVNEIEIHLFSDKDFVTGRWSFATKNVSIYCDSYKEDRVTSDLIKYYIDTCFHELRHAYQEQKMNSIISVDALMCNFEKILFRNNQDDYYDKNYDNIYTEVDARVYSRYETFKFLEDIDLDEAYEFINENSLKKLNDRKKFLSDRKKAKSVEYFCNLINTFFSTMQPDKIIELRGTYKTLELITNEYGHLYDYEEIEQMMNNINSYGTIDTQYSDDDRDTKLFYTRYLHNLKLGLEKELISIDFSASHINKSI